MSEIFTRLGRGGARLRAYTDKLSAKQATWVSCIPMVVGVLIIWLVQINFGIMWIQIPGTVLSLAPFVYLALSLNDRKQDW